MLSCLQPECITSEPFENSLKTAQLVVAADVESLGKMPRWKEELWELVSGLGFITRLNKATEPE